MIEKTLVVGQSKADAGTGRLARLNGTLLDVPNAYASWYPKEFKCCKPEWYVFLFGKPRPKHPTRPVTSFKTVWTRTQSEKDTSVSHF